MHLAKATTSRDGELHSESVERHVNLALLRKLNASNGYMPQLSLPTLQDNVLDDLSRFVELLATVCRKPSKSKVWIYLDKEVESNCEKIYKSLVLKAREGGGFAVNLQMLFYLSDMKRMGIDDLGIYLKLRAALSNAEIKNLADYVEVLTKYMESEKVED